MNHSDFQIGAEFMCGAGRWRCTDVGSRVITAIKVSGTHRIVHSDGTGRRWETVEPIQDDPSWLNGPPYAVAEAVFDEYDQEGCEPV